MALATVIASAETITTLHDGVVKQVYQPGLSREAIARREALELRAGHVPIYTENGGTIRWYQNHGPDILEKLDKASDTDRQALIGILGAEVHRIVSAAHMRGVVHGDIKLENICIRDGVCTLIDYGSALGMEENDTVLAGADPRGSPGTVWRDGAVITTNYPRSLHHVTSITEFDYYGAGKLFIEAVHALRYHDQRSPAAVTLVEIATELLCFDEPPSHKTSSERAATAWARLAGANVSSRVA